MRITLSLALVLAVTGAVHAQEENREITGVTGEERAQLNPITAIKDAADVDLVKYKKFDSAIAKYKDALAKLEPAKVRDAQKKEVSRGIHYNLACALSHAGKKDEAVTELGLALDEGYWSWWDIETDEDLAGIRNEDGYKKAIEKGKAAQKVVDEAYERRLPEKVKAGLAGKPLFDLDYSLDTTDGRKLTPASLKGKVVIIHWCRADGSDAEFPETALLLKLYAAYKDKGLEILCTCKATASQVADYAKAKGLTYPVSNEIVSISPLRAEAHLAFLDKTGSVRATARAFTSYEPLEAAVKLLLESSDTPGTQAGGFEVDAKTPVKSWKRPKSEGSVTSVCFSMNGDYIAAAGEKAAVYTYEVASGDLKERVVHGPPMGSVYIPCVVAYPLAPIMVHCSEMGIKFTRTGSQGGRTPRLDLKLKDTPYCLDFSADGAYMATGDQSGQLAIWDLGNNEAHRRWDHTGPKETILWLKYHPDGNRVASVHANGKCRVYDVQQDKLVYELDADPEACVGVDWSADGKVLATGGKDKKIHLWNADDGKPIAVLAGHGDVIEGLRFHPTRSNILASASKDKTVRLWDISVKKELQNISNDAEMNAVAWRMDGGALATGGGEFVQVYEVKK